MNCFEKPTDSELEIVVDNNVQEGTFRVHPKDFITLKNKLEKINALNKQSLHNV